MVEPAAAVTLDAVASQRQWLQQQIRMGEATGRPYVMHDALERLKLLAPDDPVTVLYVLEIQLSEQRFDEARKTMGQLRAMKSSQQQLVSAERLWSVHHGEQQARLEEARRLVAGGRRDQALSIYRALFSGNPPGLRLGLEYWRLEGDAPAGRAQAIRQLRALDRRYPGNMHVMHALSGLLFASGQEAAAMDVLHRMSEDPGARSLAAQREWQYLSGLKPTEKSLRLMVAFLQRYPDQPIATDVTARHRSHAQVMRDPAWRAGLRGEALLAADQAEAAEPLLREAIGHFPQEGDFLGNLGVALSRQGQRAQADVWFGQAIAASDGNDGSQVWRDLRATNHFWWLLEKAGAAMERGELSEAEGNLENAGRLQPRNPYVALNQSDLAVLRGDDEQAERWLLKARGWAPDDLEVIRKLVVFYGRTDPDQAIAVVEGLPVSRQPLYAETLRSLRISRLRHERDWALESGDMAQAIALGQQWRLEEPGNPWLAYALANELRDRQQPALADAVIADMRVHADDPVTSHYVQALYLSGADDDQAALAVLHALPAAQWNDDVRALAARLQRQQVMAQARRLRADGAYLDAFRHLSSLPDEMEVQRLMADWHREDGDLEAADAAYQRLLASVPDDVMAQLGLVQVWIAQENLMQARGWLLASNDRIDVSDLTARGRLADAWLAVGEREQALAIRRDMLSRKTVADPQLWRDAARLLVPGEVEQALDFYAQALVENGVMAVEQVAPRNDRLLTYASRESHGDDWLRRSLRSDVDALYQRHNPMWLFQYDAGRRSDGTPGISALQRDSGLLHHQRWVAGGQAWLRLEQTRLDAGHFVRNDDGGLDADVGTCSLSLLQADGQFLPLADCSGDHRRQAAQGLGWAIGWIHDDARWQWDIGRTPASFPVANWLGSVGVEGEWGVLDWGVTLSQRPMSNSLLSFAGVRDPRTGMLWGGVVARGMTTSLGYDQGGKNGLWSNWSWHRITGENVADNTRRRAMAGWYHKLLQTPDMRVDVGLNAMYWHYAKDLGGYTLGQGGYYSPQRSVSLGIPVAFAWRHADWSVRADASISWSDSRTEAVALYPVSSVLEQAVTRLEQMHGEFLQSSSKLTASRSSNGSGHRLRLALERRLNDHWVLGMSGTLQRSQDYAPNLFQVYLRHTQRLWQGNLPLPVTALEPYAEFR